MRREPLARLLAALVVAATLVVSGTGVAPVAADPPGGDLPHRRLPAPVVPEPADRGADVQVGELMLHPCSVVRRALCGSIRRPWEPGNPDAGGVKVGFAFVPARDTSEPVRGTLVPHEGGPGYSTTGSGSSYARMYGPLLRHRNLLLVDQRGTGRSEPIDCPALQNLKIPYRIAAGQCGRALGPRADDYTTALSADDLAAVVAKLGLDEVDLYGDSYGTFFQQVMVGRHPDQVRSVVLDSAYPTYGETGWYPTQGPAMRRAFDLVCKRSRECRNGDGAFLPTLRTLLGKVRGHPWRGTAFDADGRRARVAVNARNLTALAYGATYTPAFYREMTAAMRSGLAGDRKPLLRLVAEALGGGTNAGNPFYYSEGLDAAVACHDYPQLYDMTAPPGAVRERQYAAALTRRTNRKPRTYAPFTVREYARSDWQLLDWCTRWPVAPPDNPAGPPRPPGGSYPADVPVLVLSGEMDSITTAAEGDIVADQFPLSQHVVVRNSFHVTAISDTDACAVNIVRDFIRAAAVPLVPGVSDCAERIEPIRAPAEFPRALRDVAPASSRTDVPVRLRRAGHAAALTVADLQDRWWNNYSGHGVGLRGGTWTYRGAPVRFRLEDVRLMRGQTVSGTATWDRYGETMTVDLTVGGRRGPDGRLRGHWDTRARDAVAVLRGVLEGTNVRLRFPAP